MILSVVENYGETLKDLLSGSDSVQVNAQGVMQGHAEEPITTGLPQISDSLGNIYTGNIDGWQAPLCRLAHEANVGTCMVHSGQQLMYMYHYDNGTFLHPSFRVPMGD